ncbi:MAG TPA: hypothetical protein VN181_14035 [Thermoanaerobaculia bacterium]|nr:hypothetical protein [Thermoanaerobaculia bacterium]
MLGSRKLSETRFIVLATSARSAPTRRRETVSAYNEYRRAERSRRNRREHATSADAFGKKAHERLKNARRQFFQWLAPWLQF